MRLSPEAEGCNVLTSAELDMEIAVYVMKAHLQGQQPFEFWVTDDDERIATKAVWRPTKNANQMFRAAEELRKLGWLMVINTEYQFVAFYRQGGPARAEGRYETYAGIAKAACEAMFKALRWDREHSNG